MYTYLAMFLGSSLCPKQGVSSGHKGESGDEANVHCMQTV